MERKLRSGRTYEKITKKYSYSTLTEVIKGDVRQRGREKEKKKKRRRSDIFKYWNAGAGRVILLRKYTVIRLT